MTLFCMNSRRFSDLFHSHAFCSVFWIFHSVFACMIIHSSLHSISPCIHIFICFQLPIGGSRQPWPRLYLPKTTLCNSKREGSAFLPENAQFWPMTILQSCLAQFWEAVTIGPEIRVMQSLGPHHLPAKIAHCAISARNSPVYIVH